MAKERAFIKLATNIDQFNKNLCKYMQDSESELSRYRSWEHCYLQFQAAFKGRNTDRDMLCLWLAWYLASWGMLHNSKLLHSNYKIHKPIVDFLLDLDKSDLKCLNNLKCQDWLDDSDNCQDKLNKLYQKIRDCYETLGVSATDTLVTKVLLGTLGCVPAFDNLLKKGISGKIWHRKTLATQYMTALSQFYVKHEKSIDKATMAVKVSHAHLNAQMEIFPQMKILDMGFWKKEK
ncbi:MAG: hypothetical protein MJZ22_04420 [Candidatus Saccharibacteria bacterium]|nr:hypothetical protein [Candidatus Saccharibacteria bacterium]MCQ2061250.1 hypothetical protein [Fibrobacter sp.]